MYVVDGASEPRHPTLAGATSTGPPVSTGAATSVAAVHGLGDGLGRVHCRGTLALQGISIVLQWYQFKAFPSLNKTIKMYLVGIPTKHIFTACVPRVTARVPRVAIYLSDLTAV